MIVAKTKLRKMPKSCTYCPLSHYEFGNDRYCGVTKKICEFAKTANGNWAYIKPLWCPLVELKKGEENACRR